MSDVALALWAENSAISLKLFRTLKQRHQSLPHVAKHSRFPLSPWLTTMTTSKIICALDIRWNNRHLSHYFLVVPDLLHDIYRVQRTSSTNPEWGRCPPQWIAKDSKRYCKSTRTPSQRIPWIVDWPTSTRCASRQTQMRNLCASTRFQ